MEDLTNTERIYRRIQKNSNFVHQLNKTMIDKDNDLVGWYSAVSKTAREKVICNEDTVIMRFSEVVKSGAYLKNKQ